MVVDNPSWILPYAESLVAELSISRDSVRLVRGYDDVPEGEIAFYLGCISITPPEVIARNLVNLVVHESDLPKGRGFSPLTWQILAGESEIPIVLLYMSHEVDAGPVVFKDVMHFEGDELLEELRAVQGKATIALCRRFLEESVLPKGEQQSGVPTRYSRRRPMDSRLDPNKSIADQFNLLRIVDNEKYPAFFELAGQRYILYVKKAGPDQDTQK